MVINSFLKKLEKIVEKNNSLVCVGLDSDLEKIPKHLLTCKDPVFTFNKTIIDATYDLVCAYKPNIAFYEAQGIKGLRSLGKTIDYLQKKYSEIPVILDAKRGDVGHTNLAYIKLIFDYLNVDAVTLHPYLGKESLLPFLNLKNKFFFILCRTSNPGAGELQDLKVKEKKLYQYLAEKVVKDWNFNHNCGLVVGATYAEELRIVREIVGDMTLLIPGIGKQGGEVKKTVEAGKNSQGSGMIINSSRGIIFASDRKDFAQTARKKTKELKNNINQFL